MTYELMFQNIACLQSDLSEVVGYLPFAWTLIVKYFIPPVILILFGLSCDAENAKRQKVFGHYEGYVTWPYQVLGILCVVFTGFLLLSSLIVPDLYTALQRPDSEIPKGSSLVHVASEHKNEKSGQEDPMNIDETDAGEIVSANIEPSALVEVA